MGQPSQFSEDDARETAGATTALVVGYVRERLGDDGVAELLRRARVRRPLAELEDHSSWSSYAERIRLFRAATDLTGEPDAMFEVGASAIRQSLNPSLVLLLRAMGSPRTIFKQLARAVPKFTTTSTMEVLEAGATHATMRYTLHEGYEHSRLDCRYAQGLFSVIPEFFALPPARIHHPECQSDGHDACVYHVTFPRYNRLRRFGATRRTQDAIELEALRGQLEALQSAASELVGSEDLDTVLERITRMAAKAVLAQGYLIAVEGPNGDPLTRYSGVGSERAERLAAALRRGEDLGSSAVVVPIISSRRHHGHLAALYNDGHSGLLHEQELLGAYAGHAAAALDLILALDESRRGHRTARSLLVLASDLARAATEQDVGRVAANAVPDVAGAPRASVMLWSDERRALVPVACVGLAPDQEHVFYASRVRPGDVPELDALLSAPEPMLLRPDQASPALARLLTDLGGHTTAVAPLVADGELLGVLTAAWVDTVAPDAAMTDPLAGLADQTALALQNARLLARVRHQSRHDPLTGLPNRLHFSDRLEAALADPPVAPAALALLFCDLDRFKTVNDTLGHVGGDELLRQVAARLRASVRSDDVVARLAGDEFAVLLPSVPSARAAQEVATAVVRAFDRPFAVDGHELDVTASVGVALHRELGVTSDQLQRRADAALYEAKEAGRNRVATSLPGSLSTLR